MPPTIEQLNTEYVKGDVIETGWVLKGHNKHRAFDNYIASLTADPRWRVVDSRFIGDRATITMEMLETASAASVIVDAMISFAAPFFIWMTLTFVRPADPTAARSLGLAALVGIVALVVGIWIFRGPLVKVGTRVATGI